MNWNSYPINSSLQRNITIFQIICILIKLNLWHLQNVAMAPEFTLNCPVETVQLCLSNIPNSTHLWNVMKCILLLVLWPLLQKDIPQSTFGHDDVIKWKQFPRYWPFVRGNSPVTGEFSSQRPVTRNFDVFFDLHLNKRLSKQSRRRWLEMPSCSLWRHGSVQ